MSTLKELTYPEADLCDKAEEIVRSIPPYVGITGDALRTVCRQVIAADRAARPEAPRRQVCYGIFNSDGKMHISENCISEVFSGLDDELYHLEGHEPDAGWKILPMSIEAFPSPLAQLPSHCDKCGLLCPRMCAHSLCPMKK